MALGASGAATTGAATSNSAASATGTAENPPAGPSTQTAADAPPPAPRQQAPINENDKGLWDAKAAERRIGFTAGLMPGLAFGNVVGYPNDFRKLDNAAFRSATSGVGSSMTLYLGGTLTDWFTFSIGYQGSNFGGSDNFTKGWALLFHTEAFPLYSLGQIYRDIGVFADVGTGMATINRRSDEVEYSSSGSLSIGALGAFWETWRFAGHFPLGPFVSAQYEKSDAVTRVFGQLGIRAAFVGGP